MTVRTERHKASRTDAHWQQGLEVMDFDQAPRTKRHEHSLQQSRTLGTLLSR
jgi:hypothetical protein